MKLEEKIRIFVEVGGFTTIVIDLEEEGSMKLSCKIRGGEVNKYKINDYNLLEAFMNTFPSFSINTNPKERDLFMEPFNNCPEIRIVKKRRSKYIKGMLRILINDCISDYNKSDFTPLRIKEILAKWDSYNFE